MWKPAIVHIVSVPTVHCGKYSGVLEVPGWSCDNRQNITSLTHTWPSLAGCLETKSNSTTKSFFWRDVKQKHTEKKLSRLRIDLLTRPICVRNTSVEGERSYHSAILFCYHWLESLVRKHPHGVGISEWTVEHIVRKQHKPRTKGS